MRRICYLEKKRNLNSPKPKLFEFCPKNAGTPARIRIGVTPFLSIAVKHVIKVV